MADRPDRPRRSEVPLPPMPAAWREPSDGAESRPGPRPPSIRRPAAAPSGPPAPPTAAVRSPQPPRMVPPRFAVPSPGHVPGPAFRTPGPAVPPFAPQPLGTMVPAEPPRPRPVSPIPYPGLPLSVPPMTGGPGMAGPEVHPVTGEPLSDRSSLTAGLLQIFLGAFGAGRLYTGHVAIALFQLSTGWFLFMFTMCAGLGFEEGSVLGLLWLSLVWPVIDGIVLLGRGGRDSKGRRLR